MSELRAAFYGDDFTGSVDALLQFGRRGWSGRLFVGLPSQEALADAAARCDVVGVAGIARSLPTARLDGELGPVLDRFAALRPRLVQYKACSTADSSPAVGSLGRALEIARDRFGPAAVPMLFAQPDFGRFTVFGHHFAAEGGVVHRLDRQPTMSRHPSTPARESDLARHLAEQTTLPIGSVPFTDYTSAEDVTECLRTSPDAAVVLDALDDAQLALVGAALRLLPAPTFAIGSGGLSHAVASADPREAPDLARSTGISGPVLAVSGSRSAQTRRQADAAAAAGWLVRPLDLRPDAAVDDVLAALRSGRSVVLTSDDADATGTPGTEVLATIARAAATAVRTAVRRGAVRRVIVCGGDTSSHATRLLGIESLSIAANPWDNVVLLRPHAPGLAPGDVELLLKGGQVGDVDLFERVRTLGRPVSPR